MNQPINPTVSDADAAGKSLQIKRFFTTPGVHPFETIEWETRDARIGHGDRIAFEQRDVEFPRGWSQNATNIVAQKYFRGQLGSPEREHSVRQMIGRVAGTITGWGRDGGYFSSEQDATAFEHELTHILLHQMAAFNSPVWFNVGFEESPQCSACLPYHALVSTPYGMVPIGDLVENDEIGAEVYDPHGTTRVLAVKHNGRKPVWRVRLRNGSFVEATADHVVKAVSERRAQPRWLRVDALEVGMRMHLHPHRAKVGEPIRVVAGSRSEPLESSRGEAPANPICESDRVAVAEAALAGWLQTGGFIGEYPSGANRALALEFQLACDEEYDWVVENLEVALAGVQRSVRDVESKQTRVRRIRLYGEALGEFVERWGLLAWGAQLRVPARLFTASHDEISAYLRSIFQANGRLSVRREGDHENTRVGLAAMGERFSEDIQLLLGVLGIYSRRLRGRETRAGRHELWEIAIGMGSERARFAELVGFVSHEKQQRLLSSLSLRSPKRCGAVREEEIVAIEPLGEMDVYDIQTESGEFLTNNIAVHNCFILSVQDTMESILDWNTKEGMIFRGGSGSGINLSNIRGSMEPLAKGGTASGPVSFMRGADSWAGTIKSGGKTRRAAKMIVLDVDHPDIREFIWCKAKEEDKAQALRDAGFDMSIDGEGFKSIQYQNANNSVRLTDEFMRAAEEDRDWRLLARTTGEPIGEPIPARLLMQEIAEAAWRCADPGVQYDTTINHWHTCPNSGRINASNPCCFVGETRVSTTSGNRSFEELYEMSATGTELPMVEALDTASNERVTRGIKNVWVSGMASALSRVELEDGTAIRCTPEHRFLTRSGEWLQAQALTPGVGLQAVADLPEASSQFAVKALTVTAVARVTTEHPTEPVPVFDMEIEDVHNFVLAAVAEGTGVIVHNSEYMHVDDSACNLASINLMRFRRSDGTLDVDAFEHAVDTILLAQEIIVGPSSYPTEEIGRNARDFRQLGLGYTNLGAYLMADGVPYDSDLGRGTAAAITALMTGRAYRRSAEIAGAIGPYERYAENREPHNNVMRMHRDAACAIDDESCADRELLAAARHSWDEAVALGEQTGYRNAQATVLAPTGCLVAGSLVSTSRGLVRIGRIGDPNGPKWQDLDMSVETDEGPREATKFFVNGMEHVVTLKTKRGYVIEGTPAHRIKVIDGSGALVWRRMAEIEEGDTVPMMVGNIVGEPCEVVLPPLGDLHWNANHRARVPREMSPELAEFVGYFMGDGSLHAKGLRLCVADGDDDVLKRLTELALELFGLKAHVLPREGYTEFALHSVPLTIWWEACGFAKLPPFEGHNGKGWAPYIPDAVLHSNDPEVYAAFLRGLFEADGNANHGYAYWTTSREEFSRDVQTLLLTLGFVTTRDVSDGRERFGGPCHRVRLLNASTASRFVAGVGFMSSRKNEALADRQTPQAARYDRIPVTREMVDDLAPENERLRKTLLMQLARTGAVSRRSATALLERHNPTTIEHLEPLAELEGMLGYYYDTVASCELGEEQPTFDLSVPDNVTYIANGFISHNTISFLMDCDTTGIEPDFSLVKFKELVGGGQMTIVNRTIPLALETLGYSEQQIEQIEAYIAEHGTIIGAPGLAEKHLEVFDVAVGERAISHMGHIKMMGAVQPLISGALSKTVNLPESATVEDIAEAYLEGWRLGLKALAIYRDGSKTAQALRTDAQKEKGEPKDVDALVEEAVKKARAEAGPRRKRMPRERQSITHKFSIAGHEGYITAGMYEDGTVGEIFLTDIGKEGSTLRGMMNSFATAISIALQYGVPLETLVRKFSYMRFEPEGITGNPEIPFAKSMPDYIMRWLASRFLDVDAQEELGILTPAVRARKAAQDAAQAISTTDTAGPATDQGEEENDPSGPQAGNGGNGGNGTTVAPTPAAASLTESPPVVPARLQGLDLGPACSQCGGMMQRTGACYTCSSCGNNTGCG